VHLGVERDRVGHRAQDLARGQRLQRLGHPHRALVVQHPVQQAPRHQGAQVGPLEPGRPLDNQLIHRSRIGRP
jgi:hypothetical protein